LSTDLEDLLLLLLRGIDFLTFPTTLLSMVDASVEVKWCAAGNLKKSNGVFNFTFVGIIDRH
jgi:hypothetical protein